MVPLIFVGVLFNTLINLPTSSGYVDTTVYLTSERNSGGDWILMVQSGSVAASNITLKVISKATGTAVLSSRLTAINPSSGSFNDNNYNDKIDAGDTILLKDTAYVDPGMEVQLMKGEKLMGHVDRLPG